MIHDQRLNVDASLHLPPVPASAREARAFISDFCSAARLPSHVCETAALCVSELVTNAVIHGRTAATIHAHLPGQHLRVTVHDNNPHLPPIGNRPHLNSESGRGLQIVSLLADNWGIEAADAGKSIWFTLQL